MSRKLKTHEQFVQEVKQIHGSAVQVVGKYLGAIHRVRLRCPYGHTWDSIPHVCLSGSGCKVCADNARRKTPEQFNAELAKLKKPFRIVGEYLNDAKHVRTKCLTCSHIWNQTPNVLRKQKTCPLCANKARKNQPHKLTHADFLERLHKVNPNWLAISDYLRGSKPVTVQCKCCGFEVTRRAENLLSAHRRCPRCMLSVNKGRGYSNISLRWLRYLERKNRITLQHAEHLGEYKIPGTRYSVDGYHPRSKTVFEFLGNHWHGGDKRASTMKRLRAIKNLGFQVVYIWESDFRKDKPARYL